MASHNELAVLLTEYDRARAYTELLWRDLSPDEVRWRPSEQSSAIGWHLGHQAAVAHFMIRNLTAAEPSPDRDLEPIMDSATSEQQRGDLPAIERLAAYRHTVGQRIRFRISSIADGAVDAPRQLRAVAVNLLVAVINHEYQHDQWISEVRTQSLGHQMPAAPESDRVVTVDGYYMIPLASPAIR